MQYAIIEDELPFTFPQTGDRHISFGIISVADLLANERAPIPVRWYTSSYKGVMLHVADCWTDSNGDVKVAGMVYDEVRLFTCHAAHPICYNCPLASISAFVAQFVLYSEMHS